MKVTVLQENLARGLNIVSRAVSPRSTLPVLANILIATDEGRLRLSATNLELGITCWIGAKIHEDGSTTVPARTFSDLVSTLSDSQVEMALTVRTQTLKFKMRGIRHQHEMHRCTGISAHACGGLFTRFRDQRGGY